MYCTSITAITASRSGADIVHNYDLTNNSQYYEGEFIYSHKHRQLSCGPRQQGQEHRFMRRESDQLCNHCDCGTTGAYPCYNSSSRASAARSISFHTIDYGFFFQDNWKISPRLTLQLGLRYDYETIPGKTAAIIAPVRPRRQMPPTPHTTASQYPSDKNNFGPRIGFAYDVYGSGRTVLRGGYGMYYGRVTNGNQGVTRRQQEARSPRADHVSAQSPSALPVEPSLPEHLLRNPAHPSFGIQCILHRRQPANPTGAEFDLQIQQQLGRGTVFAGCLSRRNGSRTCPTSLTSISIRPPCSKSTSLSSTQQVRVRCQASSVITVPTYTSYGNTALWALRRPISGSHRDISDINSSYNALWQKYRTAPSRPPVRHKLHLVACAGLRSERINGRQYKQLVQPYSNPRANYGNSTCDTPNRLVAYALYNFPSAGQRKCLVKEVDKQLEFGLPHCRCRMDCPT